MAMLRPLALAAGRMQMLNLDVRSAVSPSPGLLILTASLPVTSRAATTLSAACAYFDPRWLLRLAHLAPAGTDETSSYSPHRSRPVTSSTPRTATLACVRRLRPLCYYSHGECIWLTDPHRPCPVLQISQDDGPLPPGRELNEFFKEKKQPATHFYIGSCSIWLALPYR
jgi:hypothetical protein